MNGATRVLCIHTSQPNYLKLKAAYWLGIGTEMNDPQIG